MEKLTVLPGPLSRFSSNLGEEKRKGEEEAERGEETGRQWKGSQRKGT